MNHEIINQEKQFSNGNIIVWGTQCTIDHNYSFRMEELRELLKSFISKNILQECHPLFNEIIEHGLNVDKEPARDIKIEGDELEKAIEAIESESHKKYLVSSIQPGGSPAISAIGGHHLKNRLKGFPEIYYCGLKTQSVEEYLTERSPGLADLFSHARPIKKKSLTLGLEVGKYKLILSNKDGRLLTELVTKDPEEKSFEAEINAFRKTISSEKNNPPKILRELEDLIKKYHSSPREKIKKYVRDLKRELSGCHHSLEEDCQELEEIQSLPNLNDQDGSVRKKYRHGNTNFDQSLQSLEKRIGEYEGTINYQEYIQDLKGIIDEKSAPGKTVVVALGGLNKGSPKEYSALMKEIQKLKEEYLKKDISVKIFIGTNSFKNDPKEIKEYWNIIKEADIVSMNDAELNSIYSALFGGDVTIPLGDKLRKLGAGTDFGDGLMICHSAEGAVIGSFGTFENIITSEQNIDLAAYLKKSLELAVDGTTYIYQNGIYPNDTAVRNYSQNIRSRQESPFFVRFVHPGGHLANGIIETVAANVGYPVGNLVGLGAVFDGILLSYLFSNKNRGDA
ncbi:hypothetical protein HZC30_03605 [Candidatus Woesearchaeota archaeon]|nr:hypothetical protein [Candidatus Woesearchaeota archaeon]